MPQNTSTTPPTPTAYGWCAWHQGYAHGVRLISAQDAGSGHAQLSWFACPSCCQAHGLVPLADQPRQDAAS